MNKKDWLVAHATQGLLDFKNNKNKEEHIAWKLKNGYLLDEEMDALEKVLGKFDELFIELKESKNE